MKHQFASLLLWGATALQAMAEPLSERESPVLVDHIRRRLLKARQEDEREWTESASLSKSIEQMTLFKIETGVDIPGTSGDAELTGGIEVICNLCYITGEANARVYLEDDFEIDAIVDQVMDTVGSAVENITDWLGDTIGDTLENIDDLFTEGEITLPPPPDIDFDVDLSEFPECILEFTFDSTELYVDLNTVISGGVTYTIPLYESVGTSVDIDGTLFVGFIFAVDLILSLENEIEINHGFHVKLEDGISIKIAMFSSEASDLTFNGGQFEFLPVEIETGGVTLRAILQLSLRAGFAMEVLDAALGLETKLYVNLADFSTTISPSEEDDCDFEIENTFQFGVGAAAGAYVALGDRVWGPVPETEVPLFPTTFGAECIVAAAPTPSTIAAADEAGLTEATVSTEHTFKATACGDPTLVNCPAVLQTYVEYKSSETKVTMVSSGFDGDWPEVTAATAFSTIDFGDNVESMTATSGSPQGGDFSSSGDEFFDGETGGVSNKIIIGVSVGVGVPVLISLVALIFCCAKKRKARRVSAPMQNVTYTGQPQYVQPVYVQPVYAQPQAMSPQPGVLHKDQARYSQSHYYQPKN